MRFSLVLITLCLCVGAFAVGAQETPAPIKSDDLASIEAVITAAESNVATLDQMIATQEEKLAGLYELRDASSKDDGRDQKFNMLIDRMNLTLTHLEAERDGISSTIDMLKEQIAALKNVEGDPNKEQTQ